MIVSEPFSDLPGAWHEIPPTAVTLHRGEGLETQPFQPASVAPAVVVPERPAALDV